MQRLWPSLILLGWGIPVLVVGWFQLVYRPGDAGDYQWAMLALYCIGAALGIGCLLLIAGLRGAMQVPIKELRERVGIGFAVVGLGMYALVLLVGAMLLA